MKTIYYSVFSLLLGVLLFLSACLLDKEQDDLPTGATNEKPPVFLETGFTRISQDGVRAWALLSPEGTLNITRYGCIWSEHPMPTFQDNQVESSSLSKDSLEVEISGLLPNKLYYVRPYVITGSGETYGPEKTIMISLTFRKEFTGYANASGYSIRQTTDGGYILSGYTAGLSGGGMYIIKTNAAGEVQWDKKLVNTGYEGVPNIRQTADGGFILSGYKGDGSSMIKLDGTGELQWGKAFEEDKALGGAEETADGGFILIGSIPNSLDEYTDDIYLVKTNSTGDIQWEKTFDTMTMGTEEGVSVKQTADGGFILLGYTQAKFYSIEEADMYLIKTDSEGNRQWEKTFGGLERQDASSLEITEDGGFILLGTTSIGVGGSTDMYAVKTTASGDLEWEKTFGGPEGEYASEIDLTTDGGYIFLGIAFGGGAEKSRLIKIDATGRLQWERNFTNEFRGYSVQQTKEGPYILLGTRHTGWDITSMYLVKTDENGKVY
jgi:hypothetical protein